MSRLLVAQEVAIAVSVVPQPLAWFTTKLSSAAAISIVGIVRPSAFAILMLIARLELARQLDRKLSRLFSSKNALHVPCCQAEQISVLDTITDQAT
jgi:hypothetical protein